MATDYQVEVPGGVKDALGKPLAQGKTFTFRTPPPSIVGTAPGGDSVALDPIFFVQFDQRIDPKVALERVKVSANGAMKVRALTKEEDAKETLTLVLL